MRKLALIFVLLLSCAAQAQVTHINAANCTKTAHSTSGSNAWTFSCTPNAAGNAVVFGVECADNGGANITNITLAATGWTITPISTIMQPVQGQGSRSFAAIAPNTSAATFTVTFTGAGACAGYTYYGMDEFAGNDHTGSTTTFYANNQATATTGGCQGAAITIGSTNDAGWAFCVDSLSGTAGTWTKGTDDAGGEWTVYKTGVSGSQTPTWGTTSGQYMVGAIAIATAPPITTIQNHFKFRNDDGNETTATDAASQDANITAALGTTLRLRVQTNTSGDSPTSQKQLEWKKSTDAAYRAVAVAPSQVVYTICASGCTSTTNFVAPPDVFSAVVECWGGGGAGARAAANSTPGGGGKGGSYAKRNVMPLTPGTTYTPTLGAGGVSATPTNGGATDFTGDSATHCTAAGGVTPAISSLTGASTVNGTSVGDVIHDGGNGATGVSTTAGGGGEAGGSASVGAAGSGSTGGSGNNADGGDGGAGRTASNGVGSPGTAPGGAGGGALRVSTTSNNGGGGAAGQVKITYTATPAIQLVTSANIAAGGGTATTAQLTSPGGAFTAGHISDDTNPLATTDIGNNGYEEDEWAITSVSPAVNGSIYTFRLTLAGVALTTYSVTPQWTIGTPGAATVHCTIALLGAGPC